MKWIGEFPIERLFYRVIEIKKGYYKIVVPSTNTQKSAFHFSPNVYATIDAATNQVTLDGLSVSFEGEANEIKENILRLILDENLVIG